ncbi:MAG: peptidoglycan recognition protein family protein [Armatimonadota bacterium]
MKAAHVVILILFAGAFSGLWWWHLHRHVVSRAVRGFPSGIVIHHTATPPAVRGKLINVASIDAMHARRGFAVRDADGHVYHIGYHFLVLQDGRVLRGRPEHLRGAHTKGHPDKLGIALVGNFQRSSNRGRCGPLTPPRAQRLAAERLTRELMQKYGLPDSSVYLHRDLGQTACPGDGFPRATFYRAIREP